MAEREMDYIISYKEADELEYVNTLPGKLERFVASCRDGSAFGKVLNEEQIAGKVELWKQDAEANIKKKKNLEIFSNFMTSLLTSIDS